MIYLASCTIFFNTQIILNSKNKQSPNTIKYNLIFSLTNIYILNTNKFIEINLCSKRNAFKNLTKEEL